jgi:hypothetical protein
LYLPRSKLVFAAIKIETVTWVTRALAASRVDKASRKSGSAARGFVDCLIDAQVNCPIDAHVDGRSRELCASRIGEFESAAALNLRPPLAAIEGAKHELPDATIPGSRALK